MTPAFAASLPAIRPAALLPEDSAVFTLTRKLGTGATGPGSFANDFLQSALYLKAAGYLRTALTYYALGTRQAFEHCLIVEPDGFAHENHLITAAMRERGVEERLYVGLNPESEAWFWLQPEGSDVTALCANVGHRFGGVVIPLHREVSSPSGTGVLLAVSRCHELGRDDLMKTGDFRTQRMFRPLPKQPSRGQLDLFAGASIQGN